MVPDLKYIQIGVINNITIEVGPILSLTIKDKALNNIA